LGLRWGDVDWLGSQINVERAIVAQHVDATKTRGSKKAIGISRELLERLRLWKQSSQFAAETDWVFARPMKIGRLLLLEALDREKAKSGAMSWRTIL
jgi:hypothetical protein